MIFYDLEMARPGISGIQESFPRHFRNLVGEISEFTHAGTWQIPRMILIPCYVFFEGQSMISSWESVNINPVVPGGAPHLLSDSFVGGLQAIYNN